MIVSVFHCKIVYLIAIVIWQSDSIIPLNQILYIESDNTLRDQSPDMFCIDSGWLTFQIALSRVSAENEMEGQI